MKAESTCLRVLCLTLWTERLALPCHTLQAKMHGIESAYARSRARDFHSPWHSSWYNIDQSFSGRHLCRETSCPLLHLYNPRHGGGQRPGSKFTTNILCIFHMARHDTLYIRKRKLVDLAILIIHAGTMILITWLFV